MSSTIAIARTTIIQIIGKIIATILGVLTISMIMRYLGQTGFGYYTTAMAFMTLAATMTDLGLSLVALRELAANPEKEQHLFNNIFTLRLVASVVLLGLACVVVLFFPYSNLVKTAAIIVSLSFVFNSLVQILTTLFQKNLQMGKVVIAENIGRIITLFWTGYVIQAHHNLLWIVTGAVINSIIFFIILFLFSKKFGPVKFNIDLVLWRTIWLKTWPIALTIFLNLIYFRADTIILSVYWPAKYVGLYGAPYRVLELLTTFPHMFLGLVMPLLTVAWLTKKQTTAQSTLTTDDGFFSGVQKVWDFFLLVTLPLIIIGQVLAKPLMQALGGNDFIDSAPLLRILVLPTAFIFFGALFNYLIIIIEKQKQMIAWYVTAAALALAGYFIFIPHYHYWAAAIITLIVELFMWLSAAFVYWQTTKTLPNLINGKKYLLASLMATSLTLGFVKSQPYLAIVLAPIFYFGILIMYGWLDWSLVKNIFNKK